MKRQVTRRLCKLPHTSAVLDFIGEYTQGVIDKSKVSKTIVPNGIGMRFLMQLKSSLAEFLTKVLNPPPSNLTTTSLWKQNSYPVTKQSNTWHEISRYLYSPQLFKHLRPCFCRPSHTIPTR